MVQVHKWANTEENTTIEVEHGAIVLGELTEKDKQATDREDKLITKYFIIEVYTTNPDRKIKDRVRLVIAG